MSKKKKANVAVVEVGDKVVLANQGGIEPFTVKPACDDKTGGRYHCVTHGVTFQSAFEKDGHISAGFHQLTWLCFEHGPEKP